MVFLTINTYGFPSGLRVPVSGCVCVDTDACVCMGGQHLQDVGLSPLSFFFFKNISFFIWLCSISVEAWGVLTTACRL